jgi:hypothetical protein
MAIDGHYSGHRHLSPSLVYETEPEPLQLAPFALIRASRTLLLPRQPRRYNIVALSHRCRGEVLRRRRFPRVICLAITLLPLSCTSRTPRTPSPPPKTRSRGHNPLLRERPSCRSPMAVARILHHRSVNRKPLVSFGPIFSFSRFKPRPKPCTVAPKPSTPANLRSSAAAHRHPKSTAHIRSGYTPSALVHH